MLSRAIEDGLALLTWRSDTFAYAESFDEEGERYCALKGGERVTIRDGDMGLLVKPDVAHAQLEAETSRPPGPDGPHTSGAEETSISAGGGTEGGTGTGLPDDAIEPAPEPVRADPKRFYGSVEIDPMRLGRAAGQIGGEVVAHLAGALSRTWRGQPRGRRALSLSKTSPSTAGGA